MAPTQTGAANTIRVDRNTLCCNVFDVCKAGGRSMRFWPVSVQVVALAAALALYGVNPNFALTV